MPAKSSTIAAAVPGTPAIADLALVLHHAVRRVKVAVATLPELTMWIRTGVPRGQAALDRERADPGEQVAAVLPVGDRGLVDADLQEQVVDVRVGPDEGETTATLQVSGCAPPMPSICRGSGLPMIRSSRSSRSAGSAGRSPARK